MLESHFSAHFDTTLFPILAEIYFQKGDHKHARQVLKIGLKHHPNSPDAFYILSKIEIVDGNLKIAEKLLKAVIKIIPAHINALHLLFEIQLELERSKNSIKQTANHLLKLLPNDKRYKNWNQKSTHYVPKPQDKEKPLERSIVDSSKLPNVNEAKINVSPLIASITLARVFKKQGKYKHAMEILQMVKENNGSKKSILKEEKELKKLIKERDKK